MLNGYTRKTSIWLSCNIFTYTLMILNYFKTSKRAKISNKVWITKREIRSYFKEIIWVSQLVILKDSLSILRIRTNRLIDMSGFQFTFKYLKTVLHLTVRALSGRPIFIYNPKGLPYISIDSHGFPKFLPIEIRHFLKDCDLSLYSKEVGAILSLISIFRVFPTHVKPKLDSIIEPFSGTVKTFESSALKLAVLGFTSKHWINKKPNFNLKLIGGESAGPNGFKAAWSSGLDSLAFIHHPKTLYFLSLWFFKYNKVLLLWLWTLIAIGIGPYIILWILYPILRANPLIIGKLSVVYNVAGKARVIAITNWWIQCAFKPLHDDIFSLLKTIPQDGTFDQDKPLNNLIINVNPGEKMSSFDLTAATDRIPMEIQRDILNVVYSDGLGYTWYSLLKSINWNYKGDNIKYSIGQPMGAYSSWSMLALTHHVITQLSAINAKIYNFSDYAVLGDDFIINNDAVAEQYLTIMKLLGVEINLDKSVISDRFFEFAKRLKGPKINITPLGPGLILRFIRNKYYIGNVISEAIKLNWFRCQDDVLIPILERFPNKGRVLGLILWICSGAGGAFVSRPYSTDHLLTDRMVPIYFGRYISPDNINLIPGLISSIGLAFIRQIRRDLHAQSELLNKEIGSLINFRLSENFVSNSTPKMILESLLLGLSPGFFYYLKQIFLAHEELELKYALINSGFNSWDDINKMIASDASLNFMSIDWTSKKAVKDCGQKAEFLIKTMQKEWDFHDPRNRPKGKNAFKTRINIAIY
uniref:RNA dependent RNA polymerase n=1 Tax=Sichuan mountain mitovirus 8 TaxID=2937176 RepID=A0A9Y1CQQ0_9VIRU|nr:MAG: putative RNA dependent RNA polymerase [Sichuan mountain mitovirus 8]